MGCSVENTLSEISDPWIPLFYDGRGRPAKAIDAAAEILELIEAWTGSYAQAVTWYDTEPLPSFGNVTAATLVRQGRADAVRAYIERIADGGYA